MDSSHNKFFKCIGFMSSYYISNINLDIESLYIDSLNR